MTTLLEERTDAAASDSPTAPRRGSTWARWRVDLRLARRQLLRTKGSSLLVLLLVLLPVAGMVGGAVFWQSHIPTREQEATLELGRNASRIDIVGGADPSRWQSVDSPWDNGVDTDDAGRAVNPEQPVPTDPDAFIPDGATVREVVEWGALYVETAGGVGQVAATGGEVWDAAFTGRFLAIDGEAPAADDEAMVSPGLLERLDARIGDEVVLVDSGRAFTITGTMRRADARESDPEVFLPASAAALVGGQQRWFVEEWEPDLAELSEMNHAGFVVYAHDLVTDPPAGAKVYQYRAESAQGSAMLMVGLLIAVFSGYLVVLLAGAAFAVSARRQQRSLAMTASVGAARGDIFRIVVLQGTVLGAVAGISGAVCGAAGAWLALAVTDSGAVGSFWGNWGYNVPWPIVCAIVVFAVTVGTLAAIAPARTATRGDVLAALRGARRPPRVRARRPLWGLGLMIVGLALTVGAAVTIAALNAIGDQEWGSPLYVVLTLAVALGPVVFQIGFLVAGHWVLSTVSRPLSRMGTAPRIAGRDAAANPSRVVPAFAAIAACVFIAAYALSTTALTAAGNSRSYWYSAPLHSVSVMMAQTGTDHSDAMIEAADALVADPTLERTGLVWAPAAPDYDEATGQPIDPDAPLYAVAGQPTASCPECGGPIAALNGQLSIVAAESVSTVLGEDVDSATLSAYRSGAAITTTPDYLSPDGEVEITQWTQAGSDEFWNAANVIDWSSAEEMTDLPRPVAVETIDGRYVDLGRSTSLQVLISPDTATSLGISLTPVQLIAVYDPEPDTEMLDRLTAEAAGVRIAEDVWLSVSYEKGPDPVAPWLWLIAGVAVVLVVGAGAVCLGLTRFERRPDDATLTAIGGSRVLRRNINAWQAAVIVGIGSIVGTVAGLIPVWGTAQASSEYLRVADLPWPWLALLALGLPIAITVVSWLVPPRHPDLTRRTAIA